MLSIVCKITVIFLQYHWIETSPPNTALWLDGWMNDRLC